MKKSHNESSRLVWIGKKLTSQGLPTLSRRLKYAVQRKWTDKVFPTAAMVRQAQLPPDATKNHSLREAIARRSIPRWHWSGQDVPAIVQAISTQRRADTLREAEELLERKFTFRGHGPVSLQNGEWTPSGVSRTWIRDFNRHHWFATLGFAYRYCNDARFIECFIEESSSWMDQHADRLGRIWWDAPFEVASRLNAWLWAHFLFMGSPDWNATHYERFLRTFGLLAEYLYQSIEYHSLGNHILLEAKALTLCGEVFPEFAGASRWRRKGWRILNREIRNQIGPDGVHAEGSTMYHRIIAGELAELGLFCVRNHHAGARPLMQVVGKLALFQQWLNQGHGHLPLFGDAQLLDTYYRFSAPVLVSAKDQTAVGRMVEESSNHTCWILGGEFESRPQRGDEKEPGARAFPQGGYFVARSNWTDNADVLVWDCGPVGYKQNRKHAHLDALSFTLSIAGTPLLIDPGVHEGKHGLPLRSTHVHNTVSVDGEEQGILASRGEIWSPPISALLLWATADECAVMAGQHDGYVRLPGQVRHTRHILVMHGLYWLIADCIQGQGEHLAEQRFHAAPRTHVALGPNDNVVTLKNGDVSLKMSWAMASAAKIRIDPSLAEPYCGRPEPSCMITAEIRSAAPIPLAVACASNGSEVRIRASNDPQLPGWLVVTGDGFEHYIYAGSGLGHAAPLPDGWITDAEFAVILTSAGGVRRELLIPGSSHAWRKTVGRPCASSSAATTCRLTKIMLG